MAESVLDYLKRKSLAFLGGSERLEFNPQSEAAKRIFVSDPRNILRNRLHEYQTWYRGNSDELLEFFTKSDIVDYNMEPISSRNKRNYFWAKSANEANLKRIHSGVPKVIVDTLVRLINDFSVALGDEDRGYEDELQSIVDSNDFQSLVGQDQLPWGLVEGWGAFRVDFDKRLSEDPIISYYHAENVDFVQRQGRTVAIIYRDYYTDDRGKKYVVFETRSTHDGNSYIARDAFIVGGGDSEDEALTPIPLGLVPGLRDSQRGYVIENFPYILGVPCILFPNVSNADMEGYGRSIFAEKCDLFDDLDQALSQESHSVRVSTPVEYVSADALERNKETGRPIIPDSYNRDYVALPGQLGNGDGGNSGKLIETTQPDLNFSQYTDEEKNILSFILTGILSPATLGIDMMKRDNADAQREKEKITLITRNNIIHSEERILKQVLSLALCMKELMENGSISKKKYDVNVTFSEFANPSFENKLATMEGPIMAKFIPPEMGIDYIAGNTMTKARKEAWVQYVKSALEASSALSNPPPLDEDEGAATQGGQSDETISPQQATALDREQAQPEQATAGNVIGGAKGGRASS